MSLKGVPATALIALLAGACASDGSSTVPACTKVENPILLDAIGKTEAWAAKAPVGARVSRNGQGWYVASSDGAVWVTNIQPDAADDGGLTLPMNDEARAASDVGSAAQPGAPAYEGLDMSDPGAERAQECASEQALEG